MAGGVADSEKFELYFKTADLDQDGRVSGVEAVSFFQASGLPKPVLAQIWTYADQNRTGYLGRPEFYNYLKLVTVAQSKRDLTPDLVKAALYGPASAKIPAPQINIGALPPPQPNSNPPAGPPPPQIATTSIRAPQGYPPQQTRPPTQPPLPTTTFQGGMMPPPSGSNLSAPPRPQGPTNLSQNFAPKPNGVNLPPSIPGGNGFVSPLQVKNNSVVTVSSTTGLPVLSPNVSASGGTQITQLPQKPNQLFPSGNQNHQMQPSFRPNQQVPVQNVAVRGENFGANQSGQPWPKMSQSSVQKYTKVFMEVDTDRDGKISGDQARNLFLSWKLPREILKQVWDLSDQDDDSMLSLKEFCIALYLMERFREGRPLPKVLPPTIFDGSTLPPSGQPQPPAATYAAPLWRPPPGVQQAHGMVGPRQVTQGAPRPPRPGPVPVHEGDEDVQPKQRKPTVPTLEKHLVDQLSNEERNSLNSKFQEATEADKKVGELEKEILEAKQKIEFYRNKMQEIVLYKSRCDSRLNEITERVSTDKKEVESLSKKYEDKYKQAGDVASKLTIEEATFRDIQEKKMELYRAIVKLDQDGKPEEIQARADRIQADLEEQVKALNERCKMYGLRGKPTSLVELPFGWQPGFQEGAADWDENWDKFEDEGFTFVKELTLDVQNVIAPPKPKSVPVKNKSTFLENGSSSSATVSASDTNHKPDNDKTRDNENESNEQKNDKTPPDSPEKSRKPPESPPKIFHDTVDSPHAVNTHSENFDTQSVISSEKGFDEPGWGTFDSHYDSDTSAWDINPPKPKDTDHESKHENSFFDSDSWGGLNPIRTELPKKSTFVFDSVPASPAYSYSGSPPAENLFQTRAPFTSSFADSVPGTPAYSFAGSPRSSQQPFHSVFADSVPSTPMYNTTNGPTEDHSFTNNFSRFDSFSSTAPSHDPFSRFDSFRSTVPDSEYDQGFGNERNTLARFDSMRSTADSDFGHSLFPTRESASFSRFDSMRSGNESVAAFDDGGDLFGSSGDPFKSHVDPFKSETPRRDSVDGWKAF